MANLENCTDRIHNLFQVDVDHADSWYTLTVSIVYQGRHAVLGHKDVSPIAVHFFLDTKMQESTLKANSAVYGTVSLLVLLLNILWKKISQKLIVISYNKQDTGISPITLFELTFL